MIVPSAAHIALLPEVVKNQIAAGEVIERPASVVKELVENALDAGAKRVRVDLEDGGARLVRVTDDGSGMVPEDLELAFVPHATSKLRTTSDLEHIASLGFRGEALASMGSVARCVLFSRPPDRATGHRIEVEGGRVGPVTEAGGETGTLVGVRDLFFNTPARRRFLKRTSTELSRALEAVQRAALGHPGVAFVVTHDGRRVYDVEAGMDVLGRVRRTFGAELADSLVPVRASAAGVALEGWIAPPRFARRDTLRQMWFLNGRYLRDRLLTRVLREAYRGAMVEARHPAAFLALSIDPARVDVNVHPAKSEVRFRDERTLFGFLVSALRDALRAADLATPGEALLARLDRRRAALHPVLPDPGGLGRTRAPREPFEVREVAGRAYEPPDAARRGAGGAARGDDGGPEPGWEARDDLRGPFLQVARTYVLREVPGGFEIVDQHALHERLTYEDLRREVREGAVEVQGLLVPELVEVSPADLRSLEEHAEGLLRIGVDLGAFGEGTVAVRGLPARLGRPDAHALVRDLVERLRARGQAPSTEELLEDLLHSAACRSSVMAGDALSDDEIRALLSRAAAAGYDQTCPHGRPTRVRFTLADLEKAFQRR